MFWIFDLGISFFAQVEVVIACFLNVVRPVDASCFSYCPGQNVVHSALF